MIMKKDWERWIIERINKIKKRIGKLIKKKGMNEKIVRRK